ncbi:thioesterase family protein [Pseudonocardia oroxyli]|uniref:Thioesterase-like superfamily protein n=1 Tax=Pseudonocardia oroxyli TaxID=366584 RepID=A0A1G7HJV4_PSEOR|nr:thioesterase family protein [Pseudonocardia oroxyli]SDF00678.1 Thioesterase-like superfamily protein [Pseudonocardia oroxyli]
MSEEPFYRLLEQSPDDPAAARFHATASTAGPWFADAQHLGPPSALLVRAFERVPAAHPLQLSRYTVEILGVVPTGEVEVRARVERPGRTIELLAAEMTAGGRAVLRARAWRLAVTDTEAAAAGEADPLPDRETAAPQVGRPDGWLPGYLDAVEWRWVGGRWDELGPGAAWGRLRVPVVEGEEPTPLQRLAAVADSANGVAATLPMSGWIFVNTELSVHVHRPPTGEWIGIDAHTVIGPTGTGTVTARLFDEVGHAGHIAQELTVRRR